jgi:hypothetical protein
VGGLASLMFFWIVQVKKDLNVTRNAFASADQGY